MASYQELHDLARDQDVLDKLTTAVAVAANAIRNQDGESPEPANHTNRLVWSRQALVNPRAKALEMVWLLLAEKKGAAVNAITGASDATTQTLVDDAVDHFATGA